MHICTYTYARTLFACRRLTEVAVDAEDLPDLLLKDVLSHFIYIYIYIHMHMYMYMYMHMYDV